MFAPLSRRDQRDKGATYVRGLLLDGRRKSMQPMAERLGVDHQGLQQFVSSSTWAVEPVRERLARRAVAVIAPEAWVVDDTGFVKDGTASPGVARQYSGTLGKVGNCQIGVSVHAVADAASAGLDRRLFFFPRAWGDAWAAGPAPPGQGPRRRGRGGVSPGGGERPAGEGGGGGGGAVGERGEGRRGGGGSGGGGGGRGRGVGRPAGVGGGWGRGGWGVRGEGPRHPRPRRRGWGARPAAKGTGPRNTSGGLS